MHVWKVIHVHGKYSVLNTEAIKIIYIVHSNGFNI